MEKDWSLKWLHRQIVQSATYQESQAFSPEAAAIDPQNRLLWRVPRRRLSVEAWRDAVLASAGVLNSEVGGESLAPDEVQQTRRSVYAEVSRLELNPLLARFDFPDPNAHSARRVETNTPLQQLFLMNSPFMIHMATLLSERAAVFHAGGGIRGGMMYGATDEFGMNVIEKRVHVHDLHATILHLLGVDHTRLTYRYSGRDFRLTDVHGNVVHDIMM